MSIRTKLFLAMALAALLIVLFMALMLAYSLRNGLTQYILESELETQRFTSLASMLAERHDEANPGWPDLQGNTRQFLKITREAMGPPPNMARHEAQHNARHKAHHEAHLKAMKQRDYKPAAYDDNGTSPPYPPPPDPLGLGQRLSLFNASEQLVAGNPLNGRSSAQLPVMASYSDQPIGYINLAAPESRRLPHDTFLGRQTRALVIATAFALGLSAIGAFLLSRYFVAPLNRLLRATTALGAGDYALRIKHNYGDEFGNLMNNFNTLARNLDDAQTKEQRWVSDTSHELKTPLAVLRAQVEAMQDGVHKVSEDKLAALHNTVMRLTTLADDLNALSLGREQQLVRIQGVHDLSELVARTVQNARPLLQQAGLVLSTQIQPGITLACDDWRISQLLENLLQNSQRYTNHPGTINLCLEKQDGKAILEIEDSAPCPEIDCLDKLFDRFYRAEGSRSRKHGGSGLGLAVCRDIVQGHNGQITATPSTLGGLKISVTLPL